jgi:S-adenosylmethionine uptake transporter
MTFLFAIQKMPLANALSILQSVPLAVCMAGAIFLGERVGWRRWIAIVLGFGGVLVIIDPSSSDFNLYTFLVLITVIFASARDVLTRSLSADVPSLLVAILTAIPTCAVAGFLALFLGWKEAPRSDYVILIEASLLISFGYLFSVMAMRQGEISFVSPFRFTAMIWAIGFGFLFFGELPNLQIYFGTLLVISTGIYTFRGEYLKNKTSLGNHES